MERGLGDFSEEGEEIDFAEALEILLLGRGATNGYLFPAAWLQGWLSGRMRYASFVALLMHGGARLAVKEMSALWAWSRL